MSNNEFKEIGLKFWPELATKENIDFFGREFQPTFNKDIKDVAGLVTRLVDKFFPPKSNEYYDQVAKKSLQVFLYELGYYRMDGSINYEAVGKDIVKYAEGSNQSEGARIVFDASIKKAKVIARYVTGRSYAEDSKNEHPYWPASAGHKTIDPSDKAFVNPGGMTVLDVARSISGFSDKIRLSHAEIYEKVKEALAQRFAYERGWYKQDGTPDYDKAKTDLELLIKDVYHGDRESALRDTLGNIEETAEKYARAISGLKDQDLPLTEIGILGQSLWTQIAPDSKVNKNDPIFEKLELTGVKSFPLVTTWFERNVQVLWIGRERLASVSEEKFAQRTLMQKGFYTAEGYPDYEKLGQLASGKSNDGENTVGNRTLSVFVDGIRHSAAKCADAYRKDIVRSAFNPFARKSNMLIPAIATIGLSGTKSEAQNENIAAIPAEVTSIHVERLGREKLDFSDRLKTLQGKEISR